MTIETFNGNYDISKLAGVYTVQLGGDEVVFTSEAEAITAIHGDVLYCLWEDPPYDKGMVNSDKLQEMIKYVKSDKHRYELFMFLLKENPDYFDIKYVIDEQSSEEFDRFDSAVAENFIYIYQNLRDLYNKRVEQ